MIDLFRYNSTLVGSSMPRWRHRSHRNKIDGRSSVGSPNGKNDAWPRRKTRRLRRNLVWGGTPVDVGAFRKDPRAARVSYARDVRRNPSTGRFGVASDARSGTPERDPREGRPSRKAPRPRRAGKRRVRVETPRHDVVRLGCRPAEPLLDVAEHEVEVGIRRVREAAPQQIAPKGPQPNRFEFDEVARLLRGQLGDGASYRERRAGATREPETRRDAVRETPRDAARPQRDDGRRPALADFWGHRRVDVPRVLPKLEYTRAAADPRGGAARPRRRPPFVRAGSFSRRRISRAPPLEGRVPPGGAVQHELRVARRPRATPGRDGRVPELRAGAERRAGVRHEGRHGVGVVSRSIRPEADLRASVSGRYAAKIRRRKFSLRCSGTRALHAARKKETAPRRLVAARSRTNAARTRVARNRSGVSAAAASAATHAATHAHARRGIATARVRLSRRGPRSPCFQGAPLFEKGDGAQRCDGDAAAQPLCKPRKHCEPQVGGALMMPKHMPKFGGISSTHDFLPAKGMRSICKSHVLGRSPV